jgi:hypothetical protein
MHHRVSFALLSLLSLLASCASTPVWRSAAYGPDQPAPTLLAAAVYDFTTPESEVDLMNLGNTARQVATAITGVKAVEATADGMHARITAFLEGQGFRLETDRARSQKITEAGMTGGDYTRVVEATAPRPFGQYMLFGPGSKGSIAERLQTARAREAYASVLVSLQSPRGSLENGVTCSIWLQVLDKSGTEVFEGRTTGKAEFRKAPSAVVMEAFDGAMAALQSNLVVQP